MILLLDNKEASGLALSNLLSKQGHANCLLHDSSQVLQQCDNNNIDLVILDGDCKSQEHLRLCKSIKSSHNIPVIILTGNHSNDDELNALLNGADDYIRKPCDHSILLARANRLINSINRPNIKSQQQKIDLGDLTLDKASRRVLLKDKTLSFTGGEFDLLYLLAKNSGDVVSRDQVFQELRGFDYNGMDRMADVRVWRLRKKLASLDINSIDIRSIRGSGYVLCIQQSA